jgi:hypothetical protein
MSPATPRTTSTVQPSQTTINAARRILPRGHPRAMARHTHVPSGQATLSGQRIQATRWFGIRLGSLPGLAKEPPRYQ